MALIHSQNLREEVAMDVDEDDEGTQHAKRVSDYGIEVDFSLLSEEEKEVRFVSLTLCTIADTGVRTARRKLLLR